MRLVPDSEIYKINGTVIPSPTSAAVGWEDVHDKNSARTQDAQMHLTVIARKRKVQIKYDVLTQEEMQELQGLLTGTYYDFTYYDPLYGTHTIKSYVSSTSQDLFSALSYGGIWQNVTFNVIEV